MESESYGIMLLPIILGVVEVLKNVGLPKRFCPLVAVAIGIILGGIYLGSGDIKQGVLKGIYMGLSSVGMYSGAKNVIGR
ncbi:hypothetical protein [Cellulosilyticum sp. I15G10I2]|uniref:hypothetical protein n=1 Tax=Cellulosilyticum sp. I15G10I2 TaxID=1892843 RepID=UPI00085BCF09|nr:hypothetical protein [Cellulosilyticum sp. I15G10I2]